MNKYLLPLLCITFITHAAEEQQIVTREPREWDAEQYAAGNFIQETGALKFLNESGIDLKNKKVTDIGCGTGNISAHIACHAQKVHGIDASKNMIEYAQKTFSNYSNLTFEHCFAEDFKTKTPYDLAVTFSCLHWLQDRREAIKKISQGLVLGGEFFGTVHTQSDPEPLNLTVVREMMPGIIDTFSFFAGKDILKDAGTHPSDEEFKGILTETGFELLSYEQRTLPFIIKSREEAEAFQKPIIFSRSIAQQMPEFLRNFLFNKFMDNFLAKLEKNEDGHWIFPAINSKVFHARKVADV